MDLSIAKVWHAFVILAMASFAVSIYCDFASQVYKVLNLFRCITVDYGNGVVNLVVVLHQFVLSFSPICGAVFVSLSIFSCMSLCLLDSSPISSA